MQRLTHPENTGRNAAALIALFFVLCSALNPVAHAVQQQHKATEQVVPPAQPTAPQMPTVAGTPLDRIVAIVNGDLVLDSDINEEQRFQTFLPLTNPGNTFRREQAVERLIDRTLILQQAKLQPELEVTDADVDKELSGLRKNLPECKQYHCETEEGWKSYLAAHGFTPDLIRQRWRQRMQALAFIEERFRMGVRILPADIKAYYDNTFVPEFTRQHATPPKLEAVSDRIQEVLLQQQVTNLLNDWLQSLRAQGSVVVLHPGEEAP